MRHFGLIGKSLGHSFSAKYFGEKFQKEEISDASYNLYPLENLDLLPGLINRAALDGFNVTIPYKKEVLNFIDTLSPEATETQAVNCVKVKNGKLEGYNTDVYGFSMSIKPFLDFRHHRALILGTGGAASAVKYSLEKLGVEYKEVSRNPSLGQYHLDDISKAMLQHFKFIINTTPVGMFPDVSGSPVKNFDGIGEDHLVVDLIYNPLETVFLKECAERGAAVLNGYSMLVLQAEKSWEIWNQD